MSTFNTDDDDDGNDDDGRRGGGMTKTRLGKMEQGKRRPVGGS